MNISTYYYEWHIDDHGKINSCDDVAEQIDIDFNSLGITSENLIDIKFSTSRQKDYESKYENSYKTIVSVLVIYKEVRDES